MKITNQETYAHVALKHTISVTFSLCSTLAKELTLCLLPATTILGSLLSKACSFFPCCRMFLTYHAVTKYPLVSWAVSRRCRKSDMSRAVFPKIMAHEPRLSAQKHFKWSTFILEVEVTSPITLNACELVFYYLFTDK
jgi:hypothetical protein